MIFTFEWKLTRWPRVYADVFSTVCVSSRISKLWQWQTGTIPHAAAPAQELTLRESIIPSLWMALTCTVMMQSWVATSFSHPRNCVIGHTDHSLVTIWRIGVGHSDNIFLYYFLTSSYISAVTSYKQLTGYFIVHTCYSFCSCCWGLWNWWQLFHLDLTLQ